MTVDEYNEYKYDPVNDADEPVEEDEWCELEQDFRKAVL